MNYEQIIKDNEKLIWKLTKSFYGVCENDLFQAGVVGLLKALKNYQQNDKTKFSTYAYDYIFGEMYNLANNHSIKISRDILKLYRKIEEARYILAQKWQHIPTNLELSQFLEIPLEEINLACSSANSLISLDLDNDNNHSSYEIIASNNTDVDNRLFLEEGISTLNDDERKIIRSRYFEDLTQSEVADKLNMTQVMVSRYEKRSLKKLKTFMTM